MALLVEWRCKRQSHRLSALLHVPDVQCVDHVIHSSKMHLGEREVYSYAEGRALLGVDRDLRHKLPARIDLHDFAGLIGIAIDSIPIRDQQILVRGKS